MPEPYDPLSTDPLDFIRETVRHAIWQIVYHEYQLQVTNRQIRLLRELARRSGIDLTGLRPAYDEYNERDIFDGVDDFVCYTYEATRNGLKYHAEAIRAGYATIAKIKIMLARGNYAEVSFDEIERSVRKNAAEEWEPIPVEPADNAPEASRFDA